MTNTKHLIIALFTLLFASGSTLLAQSEVEAPNYKSLNKSIRDSKSPLYYPRLLDRFMANDTTLLLEEYRALYYGFPAQEDYNPYRVSPYALKLKEFPVTDSVSTVACDSIVKYGLKALDDFPFDIRVMNLLIYGYQCAHDEAQAQVWSVKMRGIIDAILSSGDGEKESSPFFVINPAHEYDIINRFGLSATDSKTEGHFDYITVGDNKYGVKGYYFNIAPILDVYHRKFEDTK